MGIQFDMSSGGIYAMNSISICCRDRSEVRAVAAGEDFCTLLSWSGTVCDTRALERDPTEGSRLSWASRRHLFVERWSPPGEFITKVAAGGGAGGQDKLSCVVESFGSNKIWNQEVKSSVCVCFSIHVCGAVCGISNCGKEECS